MQYSKEDIIVYDDFFSEDEFETICKYTHQDRWWFGHGSYPPDHPNYHSSYPFWGMNFDGEKYFTKFLLNIIENKTQQKYSLYSVYANGHTFGTKGSFHQDWYDESGRTLLLYANDNWDVEWGGKTIFDFGGDYHYIIPKRNRVILFPGIIPHAAEGPTRMFNGLRITVAWKLILQ